MESHTQLEINIWLGVHQARILTLAIEGLVHLDELVVGLLQGKDIGGQADEGCELGQQSILVEGGLELPGLLVEEHLEALGVQLGAEVLEAVLELACVLGFVGP
eukprot:3585831-Alexandrium_andersonii.AAC.1